jgi:Xaa-Pro aminopeptidase
MVFACDILAVFADENLGVRVEDTVLITEDGCENPSSVIILSHLKNIFLKNIITYIE